MSNLDAALAAFAAADADGWPGLPEHVHLADCSPLAAFDPDDRFTGELGDPPAAAAWVAADSEVYAGGLRLWLRCGEVVALEGIHPLDPDGQFRPAPDLGAPDAAFETLLGSLWLPGGERVYAARGLALRVNPDNGLLLGLVGFAPTTAPDYRARLRPVQHAAHPTPLAVIP